MEFIDLICPTCQSPFKRVMTEYNRFPTHFCSVRCIHPEKVPEIVKCIQCGTETTNPKFCSRRCSATYHNHHRPKQTKLQRFCTGCGRASVRSSQRCRYCRKNKDYGAMTLAELKQEAGSRNSYHTAVRQHSNIIARQQGMLTKCSVCDYHHCVECCHIKAVSSFPLSATLAEVNACANLIGLCPNHHWELDHDMLHLVPGAGFQPTASSL